MVGTGTVRADDPRLTARDERGRDLSRQPLPVVQGTSRIPETAALRSRDWLHVSNRSPAEVLRQLAALGPERPIRHVLIEGGPTVLSAWIAADLVDELFVYQAPLALGAGPSGITDLGVSTLDQARHFSLDPAEGGPVRRLDQDILLHLAPTGHPHPQEDHVHRNRR